MSDKMIEGVLLDLAKRCEEATGSDRELDALIAMQIGVGGYTGGRIRKAAETTADWARGPNDLRSVALAFAVPEWTASLDAAMTLVPEGYDWAVFRLNGGLTVHAWCGSREDVFGETPALALAAAALRARANLPNQAD